MSHISARTTPLTQVDTTALYPLGTRRWESGLSAATADSTHSGDRQWIYIYNDEASSSFVKGTVVKRDSNAAYDGVIGTAVAWPQVLGVAQHTIAAGSYGWIVRNGVCEVLADGSVTGGAVIKTDAAGEVTDHASGTEDSKVIGYALETDTGATTLVTAVITLP